MVEAKPLAAGRNFLKAIRGLMRLAVAVGYRRDDPTQGVTTIKTKSDGYHSWTEEEIATYEAAHPIDSRARLAFTLLLYTGQRRGDVIGMGRQHVRDGRVHLRQQKTRRELAIAIHPHLQAVPDANTKDNMTFLVTSFGKPFTPGGFGNWFRDRVREAGLPEHCAAHGLRKAAARRLAEAGCSAPQIAAVTGHRSLREVERYIEAAAQMTLGDDAITSLKLANLETRLAKTEGK
jgi:integrase